MSFAKKERIFLVLRCKECIDDFTFPLKSTLRSAVAKSREHAGVLVVQKVSLLMRRLLSRHRMHQHLGRRGIRS